MPANKRFTQEQQDEICQAYKAGESIDSIAEAWDIAHGTLYRLLHRQGIPLRIRNQQLPNGTYIEPIALPLPAIMPPPDTYSDAGKFRYRIGFYVRKTIHADSAESAIRQASNYDGFQELTYLKKEA